MIQDVLKTVQLGADQAEMIVTQMKAQMPQPQLEILRSIFLLHNALSKLTDDFNGSQREENSFTLAEITLLNISNHKDNDVYISQQESGIGRDLLRLKQQYMKICFSDKQLSAHHDNQLKKVTELIPELEEVFKKIRENHPEISINGGIE